MKIYALLSCILLAALNASGQEFGGNPPSLKWKQVNTPEVKVIFPAGLEPAGMRAAAIAHYLNRHTSATTGRDHRKINIVLQNQTTNSNGYVGLAPWRSEFFMTPSFNSFELGSLPWVDNLAIHEYRHVQQYMNYRKGVSKLLYILLGEEGQAVGNTGAIPNWFFEGDAVFQETAVSEQGRGRLPYFFNGYRSLWQAHKDYSFMKLRNGSLKNFVPDHYPLGYLLTAYGREKFGEQFWAKVTDDAVRYRGLFYPFQKAVKKYSGMPYHDFVANAFKYYKDQETPDSSGVFITRGNDHFVSNYLMPYQTGRDSILVLKQTYRQRAAWYWLTKKGEQKIYTRDISQDDDYGYANGRIVYTALIPDIRWGQREYSVIKILDIATGQSRQISTKSKYFTPGISDDGKKIVAVEYLPSQQASLHILDAATGAVLQRIPASETIDMFSFPRFCSDSVIVVSVRNREGMMNIATIDIVHNKTDFLLPWSYRVNGFPFIKKNTVYFSGTMGYHDDIFAVDMKTKNIFRLTHESTGAYQPTVNEDGKLVYSNFSAYGFQLKEKQLTAEDWEPLIQTSTVNQQDLYVPQALQQTGDNALQKVPAAKYNVSGYSKLSRPFNFHSWRPYYEQPEWSFNVYGQNILNTLESNLYYIYNENERTHQVGISETYGALFPWISIGASYIFDRKQSDSIRTIHWNELNTNIGLTIPLNFSKGRWYKNLTINSNYNISQLNVTGRYKDSIRSPLFQYIQASASWTSQIQKAVQHINPRFAQTLYIRYRTIIDKYTARQLLASGSVYFPGIGVNHSLVFTGAFQQRDTADQYRFSNGFPFARGYDGLDGARMWKWAANYHIPLIYPDWGFGQIVYFTRIRANLFFDYAQLQSLRTKNIFSFRSTGAELYFDTKWWNQQPVTFGFRYSRLLDNNSGGPAIANRWEFIMPVNLISR
jgi:hypothetical protein